MQSVTAYRTNDGKVFEDKHLAAEHEAGAEIKDFLTLRVTPADSSPSAWAAFLVAEASFLSPMLAKVADALPAPKAAQ